METQSNPFALASLVTGALATVGTGCCCLPFISYLAMVVVPVFALLAIVLGVIGVMQSGERGGRGVALAGIFLGVLHFVFDAVMFGMGMFMGVGLVLLDNL